MTQVLQLEDLKRLKRELFQQGYKLVSEAGCNVFIKVTDCLGSQYYGSLGFITEYASGEMRLAPGDTPVNGKTGLPIIETVEPEILRTKDIVEPCPDPEVNPFIASELQKTISGCSIPVDEDCEIQPLDQTHSVDELTFYNNFALSDLSPVKMGQHACRSDFSPSRNVAIDNPEKLAHQDHGNDQVMTDLAQLYEKPNDCGVFSSKKSVFPYMPNDGCYATILGNVMSGEDEQDILVPHPESKSTDVSPSVTQSKETQMYDVFTSQSQITATQDLQRAIKIPEMLQDNENTDKRHEVLCTQVTDELSKESCAFQETNRISSLKGLTDVIDSVVGRNENMVQETNSIDMQVSAQETGDVNKSADTCQEIHGSLTCIAEGDSIPDIQDVTKDACNISKCQDANEVKDHGKAEAIAEQAGVADTSDQQEAMHTVDKLREFNDSDHKADESEDLSAEHQENNANNLQGSVVDEDGTSKLQNSNRTNDTSEDVVQPENDLDDSPDAAQEITGIMLQQDARVDLRNDVINVRLQKHVLSLTAEGPGSISCVLKHPSKYQNSVQNALKDAKTSRSRRNVTAKDKPTEFTCKECNITYKRKQSLNKHYKTRHCTDPSQFKSCKSCSEKFPTSEALLQHRRLLHPDTVKFPCTLCQAEFQSPDDLRAHKATHEELKKLTCDVCNMCFSFPHVLRRHREKMHPEAPPVQPPPEIPDKVKEKYAYVCEVCNKGYTHKSTLKRHLLSHKGEKHQCPFCDQSWTRRDKLNEHVQNKHPDTVQYMCIVCSATFESADKMKEHKKTHKADGRYKFKCDICGKAFRDRVQRSEHIKEKHLNIAPKPVICPICGKKLKRDVYLPKHMEIMHSSEPRVIEKKFKCFGCNKSFAYKSMLKYHIRKIHTNERPFKCKLCPKRFAQNSYLSYHIRDVHTNPGNSRCDICHKAMSSERVLMAHLQRVHGEKLSRCHICSKEFRNEFRLEAHIKNMHGKAKHQCRFCEKRFNSGKKLKAHEAVHTVDSKQSFNTSVGATLGLFLEVHENGK